MTPGRPFFERRKLRRLSGACEAALVEAPRRRGAKRAEEESAHAATWAFENDPVRLAKKAAENHKAAVAEAVRRKRVTDARKRRKRVNVLGALSPTSSKKKRKAEQRRRANAKQSAGGGNGDGAQSPGGASQSPTSSVASSPGARSPASSCRGVGSPFSPVSYDNPPSPERDFHHRHAHGVPHGDDDENDGSLSTRTSRSRRSREPLPPPSGSEVLRAQLIFARALRRRLAIAAERAADRAGRRTRAIVAAKTGLCDPPLTFEQITFRMVAIKRLQRVARARKTARDAKTAARARVAIALQPRARGARGRRDAAGAKLVFIYRFYVAERIARAKSRTLGAAARRERERAAADGRIECVLLCLVRVAVSLLCVASSAS